MIKSLVIKLFKGYVIDSINDVLSKNQNNVSKICDTIHLYCIRLNLIVDELKKISSRCSDGCIDDKEIKDSITEIEKIIKEL